MPSDDWRRVPEPCCCPSCGAAKARCEGKKMLSGRVCCVKCDHPVTESGVS